MNELNVDVIIVVVNSNALNRRLLVMYQYYLQVQIGNSNQDQNTAQRMQASTYQIINNASFSGHFNVTNFTTPSTYWLPPNSSSTILEKVHTSDNKSNSQLIIIVVCTVIGVIGGYLCCCVDCSSNTEEEIYDSDEYHLEGGARLYGKLYPFSTCPVHNSVPNTGVVYVHGMHEHLSRFTENI